MDLKGRLVMNKYFLLILMFLLVACGSEFSDVTLEVQMLKKNTKEEVFDITYGSKIGYKNTNRINLPIFNNFEKHTDNIRSRYLIDNRYTYIHILEDIELKVTLYRKNIICGQYLLKYKEGQVPERDTSAGRARLFFIECKQE
jgi:hypothetical protein